MSISTHLIECKCGDKVPVNIWDYHIQIEHMLKGI